MQDILESTKLNETEFVLKHPLIQISKIKKADLIRATLSEFEERHFRRDNLVKDKEEVNIIYRNDAIDEILGYISSTVIT